MIDFGDLRDHPDRFGMVPFPLDVLTTLIDKSKGKVGRALKYSGNLAD